MQGNLHTETADKSETKESNLTSVLLQTKSIIIDINQKEATKKSERVILTYTIKKGDNRRLNRDGILRLYKLDRPIEIPVTKLLGKWKHTHIGVTLACIYEEWQIEEGQVEHIMHKPFKFAAGHSVLKFGLVIVKRLIFLCLLEKLFQRRMDKDNLLEDA